uniref:Uncharacterized protein n=1 Tax=Romanomermis culicivorax TaxID=13658 RepID=A0A915KKX9_ROMCU
MLLEECSLALVCRSTWTQSKNHRNDVDRFVCLSNVELIIHTLSAVLSLFDTCPETRQQNENPD